MTEITCNICYDDNPKKYIMCYNCNTISCSVCQITYGKPFCQGSKCNIQFTQYQLLNILNINEIKTSTIGQYWKNIYLIREKNRLKNTIEYINYKKEYDEYIDQKRFGSLSKKKTFTVLDDDHFFSLNDHYFRNCSKLNCKGYIVDNMCNVCNSIYCNECLVPINESESSINVKHVCNKQLLQVKNVLSKPCPNCNVLIEKNGGCDDMRCLNCGTCFSYKTLMIQKKNSNPMKDSNVLNANMRHGEDECGNSLFIENVPEIDEDKITNCIFVDKDPYIVQSIFLRKYNEKIHTNYNKSLLKLRIDFINNKINEEVWINHIYKIEYEYQRDIKISQAFYNYLSFMSTIINRLNALNIEDFNQNYINTIKQNIIQELSIFNKLFIQIHSEYGGKLISFNLTDVPNRYPCNL